MIEDLRRWIKKTVVQDAIGNKTSQILKKEIKIAIAAEKQEPEDCRRS